MKLTANWRLLILLSGLWLNAPNLRAQAPVTDSSTWQETIDWLMPAFNLYANADTTSTCNGQVASTESQKATITKYDKSASVVYLRKMESLGHGTRQGVVPDSSLDITYRLNLSALSSNVSVETYDRPEGDPCSFDNQPWYTLTIIASTGTIGSDDDPDVHKDSIQINFRDEAMAKRCALALSHLITLAGGRSASPRPS